MHKLDLSRTNVDCCPYLFSRLPVTGCGPEWDRCDRERPTVYQPSQARGGKPGQETVGAGHGDTGRSQHTHICICMYEHSHTLLFAQFEGEVVYGV